jgi:hypothetical protein
MASRPRVADGLRAILVMAAPLLLFGATSQRCVRSAANEPPRSGAKAPAAPAAVASNGKQQPDEFLSAVRPVLSRRCTPCHEPGGKMYDKLPFDSPEVVASHSEGILRRIKDPAEKQALERWIASRGAPAVAH